MKNLSIPNSKNTQQRFIPTPEHYEMIISSVEDYAIFTTDKNCIINSWNEGSGKLFGYEEEEIIGKNIDIIFTEEDRKSGVLLEEVKVALKEGRAQDERWHLRKDNRTFFASGLLFPLNDKDKKWIGFVKVVRDMTERKKFEEALKAHTKNLESLNIHKEKIVSVLSHDLRSPLNSIIGTSEALISGFDKMENVEVKKMLYIINKSSKKLLNMLNNLLDWAKTKYASETFTPENIKLADLVRKVFDILKENAAMKEINLYNKIEENVFVFADEKMVLSILQNLISNAIKFTQQGGEITATAKRKEDEIIVKIKDTGIGMSKEIQEKVLTSEAESLSKGTNNEKGTGMGLLLVKEFLEKIGGRIWVESEKGKGSSFYFTLPLNRFQL